LGFSLQTFGGKKAQRRNRVDRNNMKWTAITLGNKIHCVIKKLDSGKVVGQAFFNRQIKYADEVNENNDRHNV
jgi:folate-dependent phosphoribosylglycinamide formyltransferase PurN